MSKKTENNATVNLRTAETAKAVNAVVKATEIAKLYAISENASVDSSNLICRFNESFESAKAVCNAFNLQQDFMSAVARCQIWLDSSNVVIYVGAVFTVFAQQALKADKKAYEEFSKLFNDSLDKKYNENSKRNNKKITALTETRHKFSSVDSFKEFITALAKAVNTYKTAQQTAESTAQQKAQKADSKQTKDSRKQTKDSKQKAKKA